ncbi:MAG: SufD family Fe-S cluster assembly protein [Alistipes sp.]|nr:SufD family Fe-S cluster assembly protein [Alistipes sp.]
MTFEELISSGALRPFKGGVIDSSVSTSLPLVAHNIKSLKVDIAAEQQVRLVVAYTKSCQAAVEINLAPNSSLELVEVYLADSYANITVNQAENSRCKSLVALLSSSNATYTYALNGRNAENVFDALFIASGSEHATLNLNTRHLISDCRSASLVKGISAGRATGEFHGLVYVAQDAQRTDAQQQNRNIELDNSHIVALPQLEIYADDVRCSHGSTVGYSDAEAIFYMRQRGISEADARRLQIEGFVQDVVSRCQMEPVCALVHEAVTDKLSKI